jgi:hypothetical protein
MDERELPDEWEALRTPQRQKAISRVMERRGLASWVESVNQTTLSQGQRARLVESVEAHLLNPRAALTPATPSMATSETLTGILEGWWKEAKATGRSPLYP